MKVCSKKQAIGCRNGDNCVVTQFPMANEELDMAVVEVTGRFPERGCAINHKVAEMVYIQSGSATITVDGAVRSLEVGETVLIEAGEAYFWDGTFTGIIMQSSL